jgi:putative acetyltransferase
MQPLHSSNLTLVRTTSEHPDFQALVERLDVFLAERDGEDHAFYAQYNTIKTIRHVVVAYAGGVAVACGAFKPQDGGTAEIKRMYVVPEYRNKGAASAVLQYLEQWAATEGYTSFILETIAPPNPAIGLYQKAGYTFIANFGQYAGMSKSVCMKKDA